MWLTAQKEGRFPCVENIIPPKNSASTRLVIEEREVECFLNTVPRLPCDESRHKPVTVELNGHVALLARAGDSTPITRAIMSHARREGDELRWLTNRDYLLRAVKLGFREIELRGNEAPAVCRDAQRTFVWSLLAPADAVVANRDIVDVVPSGDEDARDDSVPVDPAKNSMAASSIDKVIASPYLATTAESLPDSFPNRLRSRTSRNATSRVAATFSAGNSTVLTTAAKSTVDLASSEPEIPDVPADFARLVEDAEGIQASLRATQSQVSRLVTALRRQQPQSHLV